MGTVPETTSEYAPDYKKIHVAGIFGGTRPFGVEAVLYSESMDIKKVLEAEKIQPDRTVIKRTAECELIIDPMQMKSISMWLNQKIHEYENLFGPIPSPEEVESRNKRNE